MEWWKGLDMKIKVIMSIIALCSMLSGIGFSVYSTFAKETAFQDLRNDFDSYKLKERADFLETRVWNCRDRYGRDFERADDLTKDACRRFESELNLIYEKIKKGGKL
jgi:hypothetical protein